MCCTGCNQGLVLIWHRDQWFHYRCVCLWGVNDLSSPILFPFFSFFFYTCHLPVFNKHWAADRVVLKIREAHPYSLISIHVSGQLCYLFTVPLTYHFLFIISPVVYTVKSQFSAHDFADLPLHCRRRSSSHLWLVRDRRYARRATRSFVPWRFV